MNIWVVIGLIVLVLGIIVGNILLLKYSAKMPFKSPKAINPDDDQPPKQ